MGGEKRTGSFYLLRAYISSNQDAFPQGPPVREADKTWKGLLGAGQGEVRREGPSRAFQRLSDETAGETELAWRVRVR